MVPRGLSLRRPRSLARAFAAGALPADYAILPPFPRGDCGPRTSDSGVPKPRTESTTLPSGVRVVSQETYTHMTTLGVVMESGSAHEWAALKSTGATCLNEVLAWRATEKRTHEQMLKDMERIGAFLHANANREQTLYAVDILRESTERGVELLAETVFYPKLDDFEVDEAKELLKLSWDDCPQDKKVLDLIHEAAYGKDSALGRPLIARGEDLEKLSPQSVLDLRANIMVPERTVIAAAGIRHADLVRHVEKYFEPFWPASKKQEVPAYESVYVGGMAHIAERPMLSGGVPDPKDLVRVALGYECGGWHASELVPVSVLQSLLGGGDSFSAGGPGKGMYSRLYREVLNGKYWVESCEAFLSLHHQCGIFGIQGACPPKRVPDLVRTMHRQLARLASEFVSDEELARAKNMLKINFLTQLESRLVLFEDIVRQFSTFGQRQTLASLTAQIDAVTAHDIRRIGQRMMASKPSLAAHGRDLTGVPSAADVAAWPLEAVPKWFNGSR